MRTLKFLVYGQRIEKEPNCNFNGIVPGTKGYLKASFVFSEEWKNCKKAAVFSILGKQHPVPIINGTCNIPESVLVRNSFEVKVVGENEGYRITTNRLEVEQNG